MTRFAEKLLKLIEARDETQARVARAAGIQETIVSRWLREGSRNRPTHEQLYAIAKFLGVPMEYLVDDALDEPRPPEVTTDELYVVKAVRALRLDFEATMRLLWRHADETTLGPAGGDGPRAEPLSVRERGRPEDTAG